MKRLFAERTATISGLLRKSVIDWQHSGPAALVALFRILQLFGEDAFCVGKEPDQGGLTEFQRVAGRQGHVDKVYHYSEIRDHVGIRGDDLRVRIRPSFTDKI